MTEYEFIKAKLLRRNELWEDPDFGAEHKSIYYSRESWLPNVNGIVWKRPHVSSTQEIVVIF